MAKGNLDLPDHVALSIFGELSLQDRRSLSETCKQLLAVAVNGGAFSDYVHRVRSEEQAHAAISSRARRVRVLTIAGLQQILNGYAAIEQVCPAADGWAPPR